LQEYDVLLFSGAVSKGKFDFLPQVFEELKVEKLFHKVAQRPGKTFFYGRIASLCMSDQNVDQNKKNSKIIFGFPGNPIYTFVNCLVYFYPWFYKSVGVEMRKETAILGEDVFFKPSLTYFLQVKLESKSGNLFAFPILGNGSGDLASLVKADAFIQLPSNKTEFKKGEVFSIISYRSF
jgi:molybdopterin molybdotransferase